MSKENARGMQDDAISRQVVLNEFCHSCDGWSCNPNTCCKIEWIRKLPPIQPKRGKWIKTARWSRVYYCDQCRNYLDFDGVNAGRGSTNYCPNCGCRMDGGDNMTDELISKTDVVKIVKSVLSPASSLINVARARRQMLNEINELESKPEPHWSPVDLENNEPPLEEWVLVSSDGYVMQDCIVERGGKKIWYHGGNIRAEDRYMPLPEPYKGVTE